MPKLRNDNLRPETVLIELPIADVPPATWQLHINTHLSLEQSHALRRVTQALDQRQAALQNGRRVVNASDTLKYLLEQIGMA